MPLMWQAFECWISHWERFHPEQSLDVRISSGLSSCPPPPTPGRLLMELPLLEGRVSSPLTQLRLSHPPEHSLPSWDPCVFLPCSTGTCRLAILCPAFGLTDDSCHHLPAEFSRHKLPYIPEDADQALQRSPTVFHFQASPGSLGSFCHSAIIQLVCEMPMCTTAGISGSE